MPSTVEKLNPTRAKITIEVPFTDLEPAIRKAYRDLAGQVSIPGFRKGHIPASMIDARVGRGAVLSEAVNSVLPDLYAQAIETHGLIPLGRPEIDISALEDGVRAEFSAQVDIVPEFGLPDYSRIKVTAEAIPDPEEVVESRIELLRERFAQVLDVDRVAEAGDQVVIDLRAAQNGQLIEEATAEALTYIIGSGGMIEGLDEAVTGCRVGDEKTFSSTLAGGDRQGEAADITVTIEKVQSRSLPVVDDDFAQLVSQFDTVEEMRGDLRETFERRAKYEQIREVRNKVMDQMIELTPFEIPAGLVDDQVTRRTAEITEELKAAGLTLEDYLVRRGDPQTTTVEQFIAGLKDSVVRGVRSEILLDRIADTEKVSVGQEELTNYILQRAQENATTPQAEIEQMREHDLLPQWMTSIRQSKALDGIVCKVKAKDSNGKAIDLTILVPPSEPTQ